MLKMSFYDGSLDKEMAITAIEGTDKPILYRYGFGWKGATKRPITKEKAVAIVKNGDLIDITESENEILVNEYSGNDML